MYGIKTRCRRSGLPRHVLAQRGVTTRHCAHADAVGQSESRNTLAHAYSGGGHFYVGETRTFLSCSYS